MVRVWQLNRYSLGPFLGTNRLFTRYKICPIQILVEARLGTISCQCYRIAKLSFRVQESQEVTGGEEVTRKVPGK